ncbi:3-deoxy-D-manno-octulosonate 8-phosphate phosphatase [Fulvivirga imtechensis AK7]|uniref:3-deoxy-D-manno-octulosonate 8-phosphate phosphatase KdsC n=1 Tax=Fulvivirga imtechensis AK7 TaxID=1237149 RepID=L8JSV6_9BACT|nr:HAD-IIIA family hydrolase [Fulvivirga imtechensis]ELR70579.1 3-deoxy-D-manno-octulosonate 8-phosphate phosphatase [Fulvivirga imtechensis AK7]
MEIILKKYSQSQIAQAKKIRALIFDVDGVLTNGGIIYTNSGDELKVFNVKDGQIIKHLRDHKIIIGAITGRTSELVDRRCKELKLDFHYQNVKDKFAVYQEVLKKYQLRDEEVAYIGDDIIDLKLIKQAGLGIAPADALEYVKSHADVVTEKGGGDGVVREAADFILAAQRVLEDLVNKYLE